MSINWNPGLYKIGVELVDTQHGRLFEALSKLREAYGKADEKETVNNMIVFLGEYAVKHFSDEENLMASLNMPGIERHKDLHSIFIENCKTMKVEFDRDGATKKLLMTIYSNLFRWLVEHISVNDKEISGYANK